MAIYLAFFLIKSEKEISRRIFFYRTTILQIVKFYSHLLSTQNRTKQSY